MWPVIMVSVGRGSGVVASEAGYGPGAMICGKECGLVSVMGGSGSGVLMGRVGRGSGVVVMARRGLGVAISRIGCGMD